MTSRFYAIRKILVNSISNYRKDDPVKLAGTTAFFTIFAIAPIFIIITSVLGLLFGQDTVSEKVFAELESLIGREGTGFVETIVENFRDTERNIQGTIIGVIIFLIASTTFFTILQNSLNFVWRIKSKPRNNFLKALKDRVLSFGLIISIGFILLISLIIDGALGIFGDFLQGYIEGYALLLIRIINYIMSVGIMIIIFALIYKYLPDTQIEWRVIWVGAIVTAILFTAGKYLIGLGLGLSNIGVIYGAAGSAVVFLLWVFYSSLILFFGAEVTKQYAEYYNFKIKPKDYAVEFEVSEKE
ncbi:MAG: YihY/virulence factor BrkB family protein [Bacteroidales bacterium]